MNIFNLFNNNNRYHLYFMIILHYNLYIYLNTIFTQII